MQDITLVVPLFNEEHRWQSDYWRRMCQIPNTTWLFVDDGSTDGTRQILSVFATEVGASTLLRDTNAGKANAVRAGLRKALQSRSDGVGFIDGDGAFDITDVTHIIQQFRQRCVPVSGVGPSGDLDDSVWASRVALAGHDISRRASRHYLGRVIATLISPGLPNVPYDTQCGFKIFRSSPVLLECLEQPFSTTWFFDVELLQRWLLLSGAPMRVWEEPLLRWHDVPGSKVSGAAAFRVAREISRVMRTNRRLS